MLGRQHRNLNIPMARFRVRVSAGDSRLIDSIVSGTTAALCSTGQDKIDLRHRYYIIKRIRKRLQIISPEGRWISYQEVEERRGARAMGIIHGFPTLKHIPSHNT